METVDFRRSDAPYPPPAGFSSEPSGGALSWGRWAAAAAWAALLLYLGSRPGDDLPSGPPGFDKFAHLAFYGVLGVLVAHASRRWPPALLAGLLIGAADEWIQSSLASRTADALDLVADVAGAAIGGLICVRTRRAAGRS